MDALKLSKWVPVSDVNHINTTWEISTDIDFTNIIDSVVESGTYVNVFYTDVVVPVGDVFYSRAKRHFDDLSSSDWTNVVQFTNSDSDNVLIHYDEVLIKTPNIATDLDIGDVTQTSFTISSSSFKTNIGSHKYTHWILKNNNNDIIYSSLYDEVNLYSITLTKDMFNFDTLGVLEISVVYESNVNIISKSGILNIQIQENVFNYIVGNKNVNNIPPYLDYTLTLNKLDTGLPYGVTNFKVIDILSKDILFNQDTTVYDYVFVIPKSILLPNTKVLIELKTYLGDENYATYTLLLTISAYSNYVTYDTNFKYNNEYTNNGNYNSKHYDTYNILHELSNNTILTLYDGVLTVCRFDRSINKIVKVNDIGGANLVTPDFKYIKLLENNILLIDRYDPSTGSPVLDMYDYDPNNYTVVYRTSILRLDETYNISESNSAVMITNDSLIYIGNSKLRKLNFLLATVTDITDIPMTNVDMCTLIDTHTNELIVFGGSDDYSMIYNLYQNTWHKGQYIPPEYRDIKLQSTGLVNKDSLITKAVYGGDNNYLILDHLKRKFINNIIDFGDDASPNTILALKTGEVIQLDTNTVSLTNYSYSYI